MKKSGNRVTIKDLAGYCGVSTATISRVLNHIEGGYSAETEARIFDAAEKLGYIPNTAARSLVTQKTNLIAVLIPDIHYYFFQEFYAGLENYLGKHGYRILLCNTAEKSSSEEQFIQGFRNGMVDGFVVSTLNDEENNDRLLELSEQGIPVVLAERYGENREELCGVEVDNYKAGYLAVEKMHQAGHRRIAFVRGKRGARNAEIRFQGYVEALKHFGIEYDEALVCYGDYEFDKATHEVKKLLEKTEFTGLIASNGLMTAGACKAIVQAGKKIPDDISVIGIDRTLLTDTHEPEISTMDFRPYEVGVTAGRYLLDLIKGNSIKKKIKRISLAFHEGESLKIIK